MCAPPPNCSRGTSLTSVITAVAAARVVGSSCLGACASVAGACGLVCALPGVHMVVWGVMRGAPLGYQHDPTEGAEKSAATSRRLEFALAT